MWLRPFLKTKCYSTVCIYHIRLFIQLSDIWVASIFQILWIMMLWTWLCKYHFKTLLLILVDIHPGVGLYGSSILIFWGTTVLFSLVVLPFYSPTNSAQVFQWVPVFPYLPTLVIFCIFIKVAILMRVRSSIIVVDLHFPDDEWHWASFMYLLTMYIFECLFKSFAHFKVEFIWFFCWVVTTFWFVFPTGTYSTRCSPELAVSAWWEAVFPCISDPSLWYSQLGGFCGCCQQKSLLLF